MKDFYTSLGRGVRGSHDVVYVKDNVYNMLRHREKF